MNLELFVTDYLGLGISHYRRYGVVQKRVVVLEVLEVLLVKVVGINELPCLLPVGWSCGLSHCSYRQRWKMGLGLRIDRHQAVPMAVVSVSGVFAAHLDLL